MRTVVLPPTSVTFVVTVSDLLDGQKYQRFVGTSLLTDTYQREQLGRIAYVGVVYAIGASKKAKASEN